MKFRSINSITDIKDGDTLIVEGNGTIDLYNNVYVKVSEQDGTEVILSKKRNIFLNLGMYLQGKSWVKEVYKVEI